MSKRGVEWVWAVPPEDELRAVADALVRGVLPEGATVIKENRPRSVWAVPDVAGGLLIKHYRVRGKDALRALVTPGRAEREFRAMETLCTVGLPTVRPLGYADRRQGAWLKEAWFIGRLVPEAQTLGEAMAAGHVDPWVLALQAAGVVARLHDHDVWHRDLHAGNLLLTQDDELLIIDLHSMWRVPSVTLRMRTGNLAHLLHSMRAWIHLDDAPRFVSEYARVRGERIDVLLPRVRAALERFETDYVRGRSARCMRNSSEFVGETGPGVRVHRLRRYERELLEHDLADHERVAREGGPALLGDAPRCRVSRVDDPNGARVVKHYLDRGLFPSWRVRLGLGKARSAWHAARRCDVVGVPTATALALREDRDGSAYLVTDEVPQAVSLETYAQDLIGEEATAERRRVAFIVGHIVGRLSRAGLRHDDMSTKNLLLTPGTARSTGDLRTTPPPGLPQVVLIDLDNMARTAPHDPAALVRMLGQLGDLPPWVTRADRRRFAAGFALGAGRALPVAVVSRADALTRIRQARRANLERAAAAAGSVS